MQKNLLKKKPQRTGADKKNIIDVYKGKASLGMLLVLLLVLGLSVSLGFGGLDLSNVDPTAVPGYGCCDSGDGANCTPITTKTITYNGETYALLKSNVLPYDTVGHLDVPVNVNDQFSAEGERIIINTSDTTGPEYPPRCLHDPDNPADFVSQVVPGPVQYDQYGRVLTECFPIPNDLLIYTCRKDNDPGVCDAVSGIGRLDAYMRVSRNEPVPAGIANCVKPPVPTGGQQKIIALPSNTEGRSDLQIETFYVESESPLASWVTPYCKPAIYLYPEKKTLVHVKLDPKLKLLYTDPRYQDAGWSVRAYPDGSININNKYYDYLYYEAEVAQDSYVLPEEGFVVSGNDLGSFLPDLVLRLGLNGKETDQFTDYWLKVLPDAPFYQVKVVAGSVLNALSPLSVTPKPSTVIRVTLHFKALEEKVQLVEPEINPVKRKGFTLVEWGGLFERDGKRPFSCFM